MVWILQLLLYIVVLALVFWLVVFVLEKVGIPIPPRVLQLLAVAALLIILIWFFTGSGVNFNIPRGP